MASRLNYILLMYFVVFYRQVDTWSLCILGHSVLEYKWPLLGRYFGIC